MPTGRQIRAARVLLNWDAADLAAKIGLRRETVLSVENDLATPRPATIEKIVGAFEKEGIEFLELSGVRRKDDTLRVIEGDDPYLQLLDDVYYTLKDGGEVLFAYISNRFSSKAVIQSQIRLRRNGVKFRALINHDDEFCFYPLNEYRQIPARFFENNTQIIYGNKVGSMIDGNKKALIIHNASFAETQRRAFNLIWTLHKAPKKTVAPETLE